MIHLSGQWKPGAMVLLYRYVAGGQTHLQTTMSLDSMFTVQQDKIQRPETNTKASAKKPLTGGVVVMNPIIM